MTFTVSKEMVELDPMKPLKRKDIVSYDLNDALFIAVGLLRSFPSGNFLIAQDFFSQ